MAEFDQVLVGGPGVKAADVQVGFAQLFSASCTAAVRVGTRGRHLGTGGYIGLLQKHKTNIILTIMTYYDTSFLTHTG